MTSNVVKQIGISICAIAYLTGTPTEAFAEGKGYEDYPYAELFTEGKEWVWCHFGAQANSFRAHKIVTVKVDGNKIIDGIECKRLSLDIQSINGGCDVCDIWFNRNRLYFETEDWYQYAFVSQFPEEVYVYEKDRNIYFYRNPGVRKSEDRDDIEQCDPYFALFMDLNISVGDSGPDMGIINVDELIDIDGKPHRRIAGGYTEEQIRDWNIKPWEVSEWIEGIGATAGLSRYKEYFWYSDIYPTGIESPHYRLAYVKDNGKVIYDGTDVLRDLGMEIESPLSGVESVEESNHHHSDGCYDLQGRPIDAPRKGELFIRDGKIQFNR